MQNIVEQTMDMIHEKFMAEGSGHDRYHIERVYKLANHIAASEGISSQLTLELGALLHDIADHKFHNGDTSIGPRKARERLEQFGELDTGVIDDVVDIVENISFKGTGESKPRTLEGRIVQDADRLEAMGAIGIARTFAYGGHAGRMVYDPADAHDGHHSIGHFHNKMFKLKDFFNTKTGKKLAQARHEFMEEFLAEFMSEWAGEK